MPSFGPERCVSVHSKLAKDIEGAHTQPSQNPREETTFFITVTIASESLWSSMAENNSEKKTRSVETRRYDREISVELAAAIQWAWGRMLHHTRLPSSAPIVGFDGCIYEFSARVEGLGTVSGETWSPQGGLTAEMVSLGDKIAAFALEENTAEKPLWKALDAFEAKIPDVEDSPVFMMPSPAAPVAADPFADPEEQEKAARKRAE